MKSLEIQIDRNNVEQEMAFDIVANTNTCLFITGKAGTGKTTFPDFIIASPILKFKPIVRFNQIRNFFFLFG